MNNSISFKNVNKSFGDVSVIKDLNLDIKEGERLILLGPSGCGKSTILRMISGLEDLTDGELYLNGELANDIESGDRSIAMVFQNYALYPHMSVKDNVEYGLKMNKTPKPVRDEKVAEVLDVLGLGDLGERKPKELSGGQRQRVALSRAIVKDSNFFLLDEPLSNLDAQLRGHARKELVRIHEIYKQTFVYVTHDQVEAMTIGHRIALLNEGRIQMIDTPKNVYHRPANIFVAKFIGSPSMNILPIEYTNNTVVVGEKQLALDNDWPEHINESGRNLAYLGIRPENITLSNEPSAINIPVVVDYIEDYGNRLGVYFKVNDEELIATMDYGNFKENDEVYWNIDTSKLHFFDETENSIGYPQIILEED